MNRSKARAAAVLAAAALLAPACGSDDPQSQLEAAAERTFEGSFAYEATVSADDAALQSAGEGAAGQVSGFLESFRIAGAHTDEALELRIGLLGFDLFELRDLGDDQVYVRLGVNDLAQLAGGGAGDLSAAVVPQLEAAGVSAEVVAAVDAALQGRWVGVEGPIDPAAIQQALTGQEPSESPDEQADEAKEALGGDLQGFIERYVTVDSVEEADGQRTYAVQLQLRELVRAIAELDTTGQVQDLEADLQELPEQVPATIVTEDGVITRLAVDIAEAARTAGAAIEGSVEIRLDLSQHDEVEAIAPPDDAVTITGEQLTDALTSLTQMLGGFAGELGTP